ncbi:MAG: aminomethyl-transferring glycine dehydrogenase subunit GcvPA [Capsulimonadaceae bacterium]|nr:aminomethyl-transferring glycine dehydrogenase subunit GcvPA [Capsulimonadaceae bacterium]
MAYIANTDADQKAMLAEIGLASIDDLFSQIPEQDRFSGQLDIPASLDQIALQKYIARLAGLNADSEKFPTFLGAGVYDHYVPPTVGAVLGRSEFYTSYTPYQPEISQGVLQSIYEFQTLIGELFAMDVANASMYDGATGLAEAAIMAADLTGRKRVLVFETVSPAYQAVLRTYLRHSAIEIVVVPNRDGAGDLGALEELLGDGDAAVLVQHPNFFGNLEAVRDIVRLAHAAGALVIESPDPISLALLDPPGAYGVDIVAAEGQSLGCPMGFGGPLLGLFACKSEFMRRLPGRVVGETKDIEGKRAFVMTLRTREQDIRREKATSNICTNVALYALASAVYLATMGKTGLREVAELSTRKAHYAADRISKIPGFSLTYPNATFFKEFAIETPALVDEINKALWSEGIVGGYALGEKRMLVAVTEQRTSEEIDRFVDVMRRTDW